jgi:hypothetical protein
MKEEFVPQTKAFYSPANVRAGWMRNTFIALIVLALIARIVVRLVFAELNDPVLWEFKDIASNLLSHGVYSHSKANPGMYIPGAFMPPFYPLLLAGLYKIFGFGSYAAHFALSTILWATEFATPFLIGWLGARIWNLRTGQFAFLMALFWPMLMLTSGRLLNVPLIALLPFLSIAVMLSDMDRWKRILLMGLIMGVLWNNRFETPLFMLPLAYYLFFFDKDRATGQLPSLATRVVAVSSLAVVFIACLTPWLVRNAGIYDGLILSTEGGYHFRRGHHEGATGSGRDIWPADQGTYIEEVPRGPKSIEFTPEREIAAAAYHKELAVAWIKANPDRELQLIANKLFYFLVSDFTHPYARSWMVWPPSLLALMLGFFYWVRTGLRDPAQQVLWMFFGIQLTLCIIFIVLPRYRISVELVPIVFFAAWLASTRLGDWISNWVSAEQTSSEASNH